MEAELRKARAQANASPGQPVLVGDHEHASRLLDLWDEPYDYHAEAAKASALVAEEWFEQRRSEDPEIYDPTSHDEIHDAGTAPMTALTVGHDHRGQPLDEVFMALIPTEDAADIPLHLRFGGWNACPFPCEHAAVARYWRSRYGARIAVLTSDVIEFTVERPPSTDAEALELAWQQYIYCSDIVDQGVGSVATLAKALRSSTHWYFWWD